MGKTTDEAQGTSSGVDHLETPTLRDKLRTLVTSNTWEGVNGGIILFNLVIIVLETDIDAATGDLPFWLSATNYILVIIFAVELALTSWVFRYEMFNDRLMLVDALIVISDVVGTVIALVFADLPVNFSVMRIVRLSRLARTRKLSVMFPELRMLTTGIVSAIKPLFWGAGLLGLLLLVWSILAVQILHPLNETLDHGDCARCPRAFSSVWDSMITFTQGILLGDSWGMTAVPLLEAYPAAALFFCPVYVTIQVALMNVLMASVVDTFNQARLDNDSYMAEIRVEEEEAAKTKFIGMCKVMDADGSGMLTYTELLTGYQNNSEFRTILESMDVHEADLKIVWDILDEDGSGDLSYLEFTDELFKMKSSDSHTMLMFVKHYVQDIRSQVAKSVSVLKEEVCMNIATIVQVQQKEVDMLEAEKIELEKVEQQLLDNQEKETKELQMVEQELLADQKKEIAAIGRLEALEMSGATSGNKAISSSAARSGKSAPSASQLLADIHATVKEMQAQLSAPGLTSGQQVGTNFARFSIPEAGQQPDLRTSGRNNVNYTSQDAGPSSGWCGVQTARDRGYIHSLPTASAIETAQDRGYIHPLPTASAIPGRGQNAPPPGPA